MLDARLAVYSEEQVSELIQLCQEAWVETGRGKGRRLLGEWLEAELLQVAQYSPRRLLIALQLLGQAHVQRVGPNGLLEQADWEIARLEAGQKLLPQLHLQPTVRKALIGDREISLTPQEHQLLLTLASQQGRCSRQKLVETVWGAKGAVSEEAIDATISRLRKKLADDSSNPVYLRTLRDQGFELLNYEVE
jgi:DNA-binding response OmpR family regulator